MLLLLLSSCRCASRILVAMSFVTSKEVALRQSNLISVGCCCAVRMLDVSLLWSVAICCWSVGDEKISVGNTLIFNSLCCCCWCCCCCCGCCCCWIAIMFVVVLYDVISGAAVREMVVVLG